MGFHTIPPVCTESSESPWAAPPVHPCIRSGEIHVWRVRLDCQPYGVTASDIFSEEERRKAAGYFFTPDRRRYEAAHLALREVLSRYLDLPPHRVDISRDQRGKPQLHGESAIRGIRFSLSRSRGLALIAVSRNGEVGIDVECIDPHPVDISIARRWFTRQEIAFLDTLGPDQRQEAFFRIWVCKEAYLKAVGVGLSVPLACIDASIAIKDSTGNPTFVGSRDWPSCAANHDMWYAAALFSTGGEGTVRSFEWSRPCP